MQRERGKGLRAGWVDRVIAALAARQHGVVARWQLLDSGVPTSAVELRLARKRLHRVHRGVYALSAAELSPHTRWMAAVLAGGPKAVLSHWSAATLWRLRPGIGPRSHVTTPRNRRRSHTLTFHKSQLPEDEITVEQGIPVTTPARVALDLAPLLPSHSLARVIEAIENNRLWRGPSLAKLIDRYPRRAGVPKLRAIASRPRHFTRSDFEAYVLELIEAASLPSPETNQVIEGYEVDLVWREEGVIAELDSYATHGSRAAFQRDRQRDRRLAPDWQVVRLTDEDTEAGIEDLSRLLAASAARSPRHRAAA